MTKKSDNKSSSDSMSTKASHVLQSDKYSATTKSLAASVLSQSKSGTSKKK